ncbi:hypothetical protein BD289DRAFT_201829 [Coniella lustricola]|uniref:DUF7905 domain-containing protein n=1 Tax=Coniella lustricola TaxID=2025994 RepID=A0A2T3ACL7_9PEZI|nr:hypothetical protein BD289DRAFT_201829 [Coniella lustricola]
MASLILDLDETYASDVAKSRRTIPVEGAASQSSPGVESRPTTLDTAQGLTSFRHAVGEEKEILTLEFALPDINDNEGMIDPDDLMTRKLMNTIRDDFLVEINHDERNGYLCIQGTCFKNIHDAVKAIRELLASTAKDLVQRRTIVVNHSSPTSRDPIHLQSIEKLLGPQFGTGFRGVTEPRGSLLDFYEGSFDSLTAERFARHIRQAAAHINPLQGSLIMRVHLGSFVSLKRQKHKGRLVDRYATTAEFQAFLDQAASRGTVHVSHALGDESLNLKLRNRLYEAAKQAKEIQQLDGIEKQQRAHATSKTFKELEDLERQPVYKYLPFNSWHENIWEMKPTYCLIFFTANRRIEIDVTETATTNGTLFDAAAPRIFANHSGSAAVEVVVACPDKVFDWHVAVEADIAAHVVPEEYTTFVQSLKFSNAARATEYDFPAVAVPETALIAAKIENVACKVSWTFECRDSPYNLECSVYHEWTDDSLSRFLHRKRAPHQPPSIIHIDTAKQMPRPRKACGISLYGQTWSSELLELSPADRDFASKLVGIFFNGQLGQNPADLSRGFLGEIEFLLDIIGAEDIQSEQVEPEARAVTLL